jgi:hypothetical protein
MIREEKFVQAHRPYAADLASFIPRGPDPGAEARISAVWFRRKRRGYDWPPVTSACAGYIPECLVSPAPRDAADFLARMTDGRYGGKCLARWDGHNLWAPEMGEDEREGFKELLVPVLDAWPAVPPGYDGWWTFHGC